MNNIEPWCISRQLWWGHQIPAWYGPDEKIFVAENEDDAKQQAKKHYGKDVELNRCLLYTSPSPRDATLSRMPSSA